MKHSLNILVAEDELEIAASVSAVLQNSGHVVDVANDGRAALHKVSEKGAHYDLLITDNNMPILSGYELIQQIRKDGFHGKIIVASSSVTQETEMACRSQVVNRIILKPYRMTDLQEAVEDLFPALKTEGCTTEPGLAFLSATKLALFQFGLCAVLDMLTTCYGFHAGLIEGNPFAAWTIDFFGPVAGLLMKELLVSIPLCVGGGYICFLMSKGMTLRRRRFIGNLPVYIGVLLHAAGTLNNVWILIPSLAR